ncbi:MAG: Meiotic nuclear division protein 1 [Cyphobasidiales sp. Tagirdzhanova-0007]|nr:MAG: Meiotic nuclear division protein 1 [Cyphobasidiales sp. Tagirdzhanova-0007]
MSKKGLSADEKAAKLLDWFHSTKEFYSIKEVEKAGAKATGISSMVIKDVLQSLLDEGQLNFEKIGTSNYYWGYPGASAAKLRSEYESAQISFEDAERKLRDTQEAYEKLKTHRQGLLKEYYAKQKELDDIDAALSEFSQGDPALYEQKKKDMEAMKESALRWTDQISALICFARDNLGVETSDMKQMLDLPEDYEELTFH